MIVEVWCRPWKYPPSTTVRPILGAIWVRLSNDPDGLLNGNRRSDYKGFPRKTVYKHPDARSSRPPARPWDNSGR